MKNLLLRHSIGVANLDSSLYPELKNRRLAGLSFSAQVFHKDAALFRLIAIAVNRVDNLPAVPPVDLLAQTANMNVHRV